MAYTTIDKPTDYFNTVLYTGNGSDNHSITGVNFQPDFVWIKPRNEARGNHLQDVIRGVNGALITNETSAEYTGLTTVIKSFDSDGFTLGTSNDVNKSSNTHVAWNWLAGGSASSNTDGSITSSVSANTTAGFSIVSYTGNSTGGATVGHGLGSVPNWIIVKDRDNTRSWTVYHQSMGNTHGIYLNATSAKDDDSVYWNDTTPSSSVFTLGSSNETNASASMIAYCFAEKKGYSKFGSYEGNGVGSGGGPFIYLGFKPAFFLLKEIDGADNWTLMDNKRLGYNKLNHHLFPNLNNAEYASDRIELMSNGVKVIDNDGSINQSGQTYIYMAFAEAPFVSSGGIPTTAR